MMSREQLLLDILSEECAEVIQRASKAIRFGLEHTGPYNTADNRTLLEEELGDLMGMIDMLGLTPDPVKRAQKPAAVEKYKLISIARGRVEQGA
jgi:hypothetical protein